tara:strand:+ start:208 stop:1308 length:1101 start_codon:yes stop_codon:yes gene_type:complete
MSFKYPIITINSLVYNNANFFEDSLLSVINQTYPSEKIEHIIVDDFSTDNSINIVESLISKYNHKCIFLKNKQNLGITKSLNKALSLAKGKYWTGISDDIWKKDRLEVLVKNLESSKFKAPLACSNFVTFNREINLLTKPYFPKNFKFPNDVFSEFLTKKKLLISTPTVMINTSDLKKIGGYNESFLAEDFDLWIKILSGHKIIYVDKVLVGYRKHKKSVSSVYWNRMIKDCYQSIVNIQNCDQLSEQQRMATLIKKLDLSKKVISIEIGCKKGNFKSVFTNLYKGLKEHNSYSKFYKRYGYDLLDDLFIYLFKRNSFLARQIRRSISHKFKNPHKIYNFMFFIGNISKRLDYYFLILISKFESVK